MPVWRQNRMARKPLIAIVDDDQTARESTTDLVKSMGFNVKAFSSAEEFLKSGFVQGTSCLIADMRMHGMSGLDLRRQLAASGHIVPTILITAYPNDRDHALARRSGVTSYLAKPFDDDVLLASVCLALSPPTLN